MQKEELYLSIEKILDEWDPIGILQTLKPLVYTEGAIGEYTSYVKPVISAHLSNRPMSDFLIKVQTDLRNYPNEEQMLEIKLVSEKLFKLLSNINTEFLQKCVR